MTVLERVILPRETDALSAFQHVLRTNWHCSPDEIEMFTADFRYAFHSLPLRQNVRRYVVSKDLHGRYHVSKVVLFGLAPGPLLWARLASAAMRLSQAVAHDGESSAVCYVDDPLMIIIGQTAHMRLLGFLRYAALWTALGLDIAWNQACRGCKVV